MFGRKKYDISNFYIGELYISYTFGNLLALSNSQCATMECEGMQDLNKACENGAIYLQYREIDWEERRNYKAVLTLFYRDEKECICLHNGETYQEQGGCYYRNLIPLSSILNDLVDNVPNQISNRKALNIFDDLMKNKAHSYYNKHKYPIEKYFVGTLNMETGYKLANSKKTRQVNLPLQYILSSNGAKCYGEFGLKLNQTTHFTSQYDCLFLRDKDGFYNLHNFQYYSDKSLEKQELTQLIHLYETLAEYNNQQTPDENISIAKALKLYRKKMW